VVYMKRVIRDLEAKAQAEAAARASGSATAAAPPKPRTAEEISVQRRIQEIRQEIASVDVQITTKQAEERRLRDQIAQYEGRVASTPGLEAELTALTRDYDTVRRTYESLLAKQEESKVAAALERRQIGEVFKVLDPARLPEGPASPNRFLINLLGALAGFAIGLGLVALLEYRDLSLHSDDDVSTVLRLPVLASIPVIETSKDRRRRRRNRLMGLAGAAVIVVAVLGAAAAAWSRGLIRLPLLFR